MKHDAYKDKPKRFYVIIILFTLSGAIMVGHGTRMMYQGLFQPGSYYTPNLFDVFFDWLTLALLGCFLLCWALVSYYHAIKKNLRLKQHQSSDEDMLIHPT